jgi:hypothetical protein
MIDVSHIAVLSQPGFVAREVCRAMAAPRRAPGLARRLAGWLGAGR